MGIALSTASLSRLIAPVTVVSGYTRFGPTLTFAAASGLLLMPMAWICAFRQRLDATAVRAEEHELSNLRPASGASK